MNFKEWQKNPHIFNLPFEGGAGLLSGMLREEFLPELHFRKSHYTPLQSY